ncbi:MAG: RND transporter [Gammaproteobacteria bacterium]|nr:RND transporter [Gammaproteobacteria bacterium]
MQKFLDNFSFPILIIIALLLGTAPFGAQPHLLEKINMLMSGTLVAPLDIFDLLFHSAPIILLIIKTVLFFKKKT